MKKIILALLVSVALTKQAKACDICGNVNHLNPYLFPHLSRSYVSIAYLRNQYTLTEEGLTSKIASTSLLVSGQYNPNNKIKLTALLPYQVNRTESITGNTAFEGIGDATVLANYNAFLFTTNTLKHAFNVGAGVKLPTGKYNKDKSADLHNENFQLGTGSLDYLLNATYRVSKGNFTVNALGAYKYTTSNDAGYRYGDVLTTGATAVYVINQKDISLAPYLQIIREQHFQDAAQHVLQDESGGRVLYAGGGLDLSTSKLTVGIIYQAAAQQNLMQKQLTVKPKFSARISFTL